MRFSHLILKNWRNFRSVDVDLGERVFVFGANASGKSNLLDAFRFLHDVAEEQGGLRRAVEDTRRGFRYMRSLHARKETDVTIEVAVEGEGSPWHYRLVLKGDNRNRVLVKQERLLRGDEEVFTRPDKEDKIDPERLSQTFLEQVNANASFRPLAQFFASIDYVHIVPHLVRGPGQTVGREQHALGADLLARIARTNKRKRERRLKQLNGALAVVLPQFKELKYEIDDVGKPHLSARYAHWRPGAGWQREDQFSDGTLRFLGLLWSLLDGDSPVLLEEPELSLHAEVVRQLPRLFSNITSRTHRQLLVSTHSEHLVGDSAVDPSEVLILEPTDAETKVSRGSDNPELVGLARAGSSLADALLALTRPTRVERLAHVGT